MRAGNSAIVLGGGIVGVTSAYFLARHGLRVTLIERRSAVGLETSFANGGLLTPSMSDPWAAPGLPRKLLGWLGRDDAPFLLRLGALPGLMSWGLKFLRNCNEESWRRNTATILRIAEYSHAVLDELTRGHGLAYDLSTLGTLKLFRDEISMSSAQRSAAAVGELGVAVRPLDAAGCRALEPALTAQSDALAGGLHFPDDRSGDAYTFTRALAELCREARVTFRFNEEVRGIVTDKGGVAGIVTDKERLHADTYLLALGSMSPRLAPGFRLPIYPVKGYSVTLSTEGWNAAPRVPLIDDGRKMGFTRLGDRLRLAGTAEFNGYNLDMNERRSGQLIEGLMALFPDFPNRHMASHWTGLRPMTPDGIPVLGESPLRNLYLNVGHGHLGWTLACGSAKAVADLMVGQKPAMPLDGTGLGRF